MLKCEILGESHPNAISLLNDLALAYGVFDCRKKAECEEKGLRLGYKYLGETHATTLMFLNNLPVAYRELGEYQKEVECLNKLYTLRSKMLGKRNLDVLTVLRRLARACHATGNATRGKELYDEFCLLIYFSVYMSMSASLYHCHLSLHFFGSLCECISLCVVFF